MSGATLSGGSGVELCETGGRALKLQTDTPHLVSLGGGRLSTAVTLHPIPQGRVTLGSGPSVDIPVQGTGVQPLHCHIENSSGVVTLYPQAEQISVDGVRVHCPTRLAQGVMLTIGRSNIMRFNHPAEAKLMKSVLPNSRISMAPITFEQQDSYPSKFNKKPPVAPRRSPRESYSDIDEPNCIMSKVSKFEYLAAQNSLKAVSPKVFSSNLVTVNTPAKDVLGKAPPNLQNYTKNLSQPAINYADNSVNYSDKNHSNKNKTPDRHIFGRKSPSQYVNVTINDTKNCNNRVIIHENGCIPKHQNAYVNVSVESNSFSEMNNLNNKNFGSNQSLKNIGANNFGRIATPSPSFNRNPSPYFRSVTPSPVQSQQKPLDYRTGSVGELNTQMKGVSGSIEDLTQRKTEAELKRNQAYVERRLEEEDKKKEQARLEEIVNMCAEYEKQAQWEKNNKPTQNRIKTNGSLPRDKRQCTSPSQTSEEQMFQFEGNDRTPRDNKNWNAKNNITQYENVSVNQFQQVVASSTPNSDHGSSMCYENVEISNLEENCPYENVVVTSSNSSSPSPYPQSPRTRIKTYIHSSHKESTPKENHEIIENKFSFNLSQEYDQSEPQSPREPSSDNMEMLDTPKRKLNPQKFILPIEIENNTSTEGKMKEKLMDIKQENEKSMLEKLRNEKKEIMCVMVTIKRKIADIEIQEEELLRELEMEKALLTGEHQSKATELVKEEMIKEKLLARARQIEIKMEECRITQSEHQEDCKNKLESALIAVNRLEHELSKISKSSSTYPDIIEELAFAQEQLENERKTFEDLEFHHLEEEADWLASREELQREILDLSNKIEDKKSVILDLETQKDDTLNNTTQESRLLERQLLSCMRKLEDCRNRLALIDSELQTYSDRESDNEISSDSENERTKNTNNNLHSLNLLKNQLASMSLDKPKTKKRVTDSPKKVDDVYNMSQSFNEKLLQEKSILDFDESVGRKCPSQDDIDRISKVTSNAPINFEEGRGSLGKKTIESLKEIERNRQLHLAQQGSQVIELERRRMIQLKQKAQDEVRIQWAQNRHKDCTSLNSTGSEETQLDSVSGSDETDKRNSATTTSGNEQNQPDSIKLRSESEGADSPRPLSESSEMSCDTGISDASPLQGGTLNRRPRSTRPSFSDKHRPLTRYLPIRSAELDLRKHIETAGHQVDLCQHVSLNATQCKGFLHKMGSKLHGWSRRWFVFDRTKRTLAYYSDKSEKKPRGGAYFQAIEEVYLDHQNMIKSPNPHLTFIIKTHERSYHLMAPSPEAMRIWVDVVFTGAEGYQEFEHGT